MANKSKEKPVKEEYIHHRKKSMGFSGLFYKDKPKRLSNQGRQRSPQLGRRIRRVSTVALPDEAFHLRQLAVHCMLFLNARKTHPEVGTLLVGLENGVVQVWNHHIQGSFITSFSAIHKAGDYVISMATDEKNEFLFTGTTVGYIKTWLLKNYCVLPADEEHICMPKYRLMFPFLWGNTFMGRAARMVADQPKPVLLSSFKGHFMPVSGLTYIDECQILISCSADFSVRMWTLGGRYLQTIGTFKPYKSILPTKPVAANFPFSIPPDIKKVASSTTLRVLSGGSFEKRLTIKQLARRAETNLVHVDETKIFGTRLEAPILGNFYALPERTKHQGDITFDMSFPYIPVYQHLTMPEPMPIESSGSVYGKNRRRSSQGDHSINDKK
ncbi:hypothetical protein NQ315_013045 [Exocentrus adspersus]|uniref:WD repeat-containing protein on Y chromosome n=1 Tax=Exocentrus adspersus TaxID=1586481 RepID=A0AAV8VWN1_9CUCU|nr:hypothetical protein NQ315_013045 [Exocentrus adspersus]